MDESFSYLLPDQKLLALKITQEDIVQIINGKKKRKVYENVEYDQQQKKHIKDFRNWAQGKDVKYNIPEVPDKTIIRYLYSFDFNYQESYDKLKIYLDWYNDPKIQRFDDVTLELINSGFCYTYGRDVDLRSVIYLNVSLMDMSKYTIDDYLSAINAIANVVIEKLFIKGKLQNYNFVIDTGNKNFSSLPLNTVKQMVLKLSYVYSMRMGKMLIINCNYLIKLMYSAVSPFLADVTKQKIKLLSYTQIQDGKMKEYIDMNELQQKYGGFRQNLKQMWPPKIPGKQYRKKDKQLEQFQFQDQKNKSEYFSCQNNQQLFQIYGQNMVPVQGCCSSNQCTIY